MAFMCLAVLLWTCADMLVGAVRRHSILQVVWVRYGVHLFALAAILGPERFLASVATRRPAAQLLRGLAMAGLAVLAMPAFAGLRGRDALALFQGEALIVLCLAPAVLRERVPAHRWGAAVLGLAGALLVLEPGTVAAAPAAAAALGMAACFAAYQVLTRLLRFERRPTNLLWPAVVVFLPLTVFQPFLWTAPTAADGLAMAAIGVLGLGVLWALERACALAEVSLLAPCAYLQPIGVGLALSAVRGQAPDGRLLLGAALVGAALGLVAWRERARPAGSC
jgi:drug/metabolite transporter (DMT)-like permease